MSRWMTLLMVALCGCGSEAGNAEPGDKPLNVVFLVLDTLRSDHLGCYGYSRNTSPQLDALAERSDRYASFRSVAPWTLPSHASMFTGMHPFQHGAHTVHRDFFKSRDLGGGNVNGLDQSIVTLAEVFHSEGYATGAFVANRAYLSEKYQLNQGFDTYLNEKGKVGTINRQLLDWIDQQPKGPFFAFANYMDVHRPYNTTPRPDFLDGRPIDDNSADNLDRAYEMILSGKNPHPKQLLAKIIDQYDLGIANLDAGLGELFEELEKRGLADHTLVVVTADHGEFFGEHQLIEHSKDVYEPVMRVPLLVHHPGQTQGVVIDEPTSGVQVPGLILSACGLLDTAADLGFCTEEWSDFDILAENHFTRLKDMNQPWGARFDRERRVIYRPPLKYIASSDGKDELYDLDQDPDEQKNLLATRPEHAGELDRRLLELHQKFRREIRYRGQELTEDEVRNLVEMGYMDASELERFK